MGRRRSLTWLAERPLSGDISMPASGALRPSGAEVSLMARPKPAL